MEACPLIYSTKKSQQDLNLEIICQQLDYLARDPALLYPALPCPSPVSLSLTLSINSSSNPANIITEISVKYIHFSPSAPPPPSGSKSPSFFSDAIVASSWLPCHSQLHFLLSLFHSTCHYMNYLICTRISFPSEQKANSRRTKHLPCVG